MTCGSAFPGMLDFYVQDMRETLREPATGIVVGWDSGYLVVMTDERTLVRILPWNAKVIGKAVITAKDEEPEDADLVTEPKERASA